MLLDRPLTCQDSNITGTTDRSSLSMEGIGDFATSCDTSDAADILERQIRYNSAIAEEGIRGNYGANIGSVLLKTGGDTVRNRAKVYAAAGSDARMNGCEMPVIINSGSGNQGIAYLLGGDYNVIIHTVVNALAIVNGIVCVGAKASCAAKIASSVDAGILGYEMYCCAQEFKSGDGIVMKDIETTFRCIGRLAKDGMKQTNDEILSMMIGHQ